MMIKRRARRKPLLQREPLSHSHKLSLLVLLRKEVPKGKRRRHRSQKRRKKKDLN
jgi:hypothetical protein